MKNWTKITPEDIKVYLHPLQVEALRRFVDPLPAIIKDVVAIIRAKTGRSIQDPEMIPIELKSAACHLVIEQLQSRIPAMKLTADQIRNANNARAMLTTEKIKETGIVSGKLNLKAKYQGL